MRQKKAITRELRDRYPESFKKSIPIKTFAEGKEAKPGFFAVDLVSPEGQQGEILSRVLILPISLPAG